jgi:hypothetical protein
MTYIERQQEKARRDQRRQSETNARNKRAGLVARLAAGALCAPKKGGA